ncbi:MAG: M23 family metallopeptidase, partial [Saprospiraceae bacterium]
MNIKRHVIHTILGCLISITLYAQKPFEDLRFKDALVTSKENDANYPCITDQQYKEIERRCNENAKAIFGNNPIEDHTPLTLLKWPLRAAKGLTDCSYYFISAHVDHDKATTTFKDYNCGSNTYDGHRGTDIATAPFPFYKMDNNQVEVIAAASGTIIDKHDGEFDKNCPTVSGNPTANYIVLQHSDGSRTLYLHVKKNSLTAKAIGQSVAAEEFLAIVGSSGNSSGPHLHFEVWSGSTVSTLVDPFSGACNILNTSSWWLNQKPYLESSLIKASTHTTDIVFPTCPATETLNESTSFAIPFQGTGLPAGFAKFYIFLRHEIIGMTADMQILNPNGTLFQSWTYTSTTNAKLNARAYSKKLPTIPGKYLFQA